MHPALRLLAVAAVAGSLSGCLRYALSEVDSSDSAIRARLEAELRQSKDIDLRYVTIDVHSRIVTLSGIVSAFEDRRTIVRIATRTKGVDQVVDNLVFQEE